jgi:REP element-mobilizing transposase RayT
MAITHQCLLFGTDPEASYLGLTPKQENFTGCRALSYCLMDNHFHILLEVPGRSEAGGVHESA